MLNLYVDSNNHMIVRTEQDNVLEHACELVGRLNGQLVRVVKSRRGPEVAMSVASFLDLSR